MSDEQSKFTGYGSSFQTKVISSLLADTKYSQTIGDILEPVMFDSEANQWLVDIIKEYYVEYKTNPTLDVLKIKINDIQNDILQASVIVKLKEAWQQMESTDLEFIKEESLEFCKNQILKNAIIKSVDLLQNKEYDSIKGLIDGALKAGSERDIGHDYIVGLEERLTKSVRDTVETPWDSITELMDGGAGAGELIVVVAPAGIGKTWVLQTVAAHGVKKGLTVVHYTLELNQNYVGLRYDTIISGIPTANIKYHQDEVKAVIDALPGKMIIKYWPTRSASVQTIAAHLKQMEIQNIIPDLVVVDYADILRDASGATEKRFQLGNIYEDLRGMAGEFNIPVWTASQANRSALEEEIIDASKVAEDYSKVMTADFVMSISRQVSDKIANTARGHVIKNRFGQDGITLPMNMNTNVGKIEIFEGQSFGGKEQQKKMNNGDEYVRKELKNRYKDLMNDDGEKKLDGYE